MHSGLPADTFAGITVIDFSRLLPGPFCTQLLADLGARVIKVEPAEGGDYARWYPPLLDATDHGYGTFFSAVNRGKESVAVDLKHPDGVAFVKRLLQRADVAIDGFRPGVLERLGLGAEVMRDANPQLVLARISGFGQSGPDAKRAGHDLGYLARSGVLSLQGPLTGAPAIPAVQVADLAGGALYAAFAIAAALYRRTRTFQGAAIDVSMVEGAMSLLRAPMAERAAGMALDAAGAGLLTGGVPCYRCYGTSDGRYIAVAALEPHFWAAFCELIERPDLATCGLSRGQEAAQTAAAVAEAVGIRTFAQWRELLATVDVCVEPVLTLDEVAQDAQHVARGALGPDGLPLPPTSPRLTEERAVPRLGEHTDRLARALGYTDEELHLLIESRTVVCAPPLL